MTGPPDSRPAPRPAPSPMSHRSPDRPQLRLSAGGEKCPLRGPSWVRRARAGGRGRLLAAGRAGSVALAARGLAGVPLVIGRAAVRGARAGAGVARAIGLLRAAGIGRLAPGSRLRELPGAVRGDLLLAARGLDQPLPDRRVHRVAVA